MVHIESVTQRVQELVAMTFQARKDRTLLHEGGHDVSRFDLFYPEGRDEEIVLFEPNSPDETEIPS